MLGSVAYPADTDRILVDLQSARAPEEVLAAVVRLPDRMYMDTDDLEQALDAAEPPA